MRNRLTPRLGLLVLAAAVLGCASATKRYEQGTELEARGAYADAAERYIQALRKDRTHPESRARLLEVGPQAIDAYLEVAEAEHAAGNETRRAEHYLAIDALVRDAADVGVPLMVAEAHDHDRRAAMQAAIAQLLDQGQDSEERRRWPDAIRAYDKIARYEPTLEQAASVREAIVRSTIAWADADLTGHRYRSALERADRAILLLGGPEHPDASHALALRAAALERGTIYVAFTPLWRSDAAARFMTAEFLDGLNDELELRHWTEPPLFVAATDPVLVRRELRHQGYSRSMLTPREAARLGRDLEADYLMTGEVGIFTLTDRDVRREARKASTHSGTETTYTIERGTMTSRVRVRYAVMDVHARREVRQDEVDVSESEDFERVLFSGNPDELVLSRNERRRFDPERQREATRTLEERTIARAAFRLADEVYRDLLQMVR